MSIYGRYIEIFSDPFFWVLFVILVSVFYTVYHFIVLGRTGFSYEEAYLSAQLKHYGFKMLNAEKSIDTSGPFEKPQDIQPIEDDSEERNQKIQLTNSAIYRVTAKKNEEPEKEFWARVEYQSTKLSAIYWMPGLEANS